jgi:hypothetical protein
MKLFIDDLRNAPDDSWIVVRTVTGAIRALATMEVDIISLDHDISHQVSVDGNSRPFACLARIIHESQTRPWDSLLNVL